MSTACAKCKSFVCRAGRADAVPEDCPMRGDFPAFGDLYRTPEQQRLAQRSALVEALGYCRWTRLREIAEFATRMEYERLGIGYCPDMAREALLAALYFRDQMLEARLPPQTLDCDPLGQAQLFTHEATQLNVIAGMCVGHEAIFIRASRAPVTSLVARDERFSHNPAASLYTADSYAHSELYDRPKSHAAPALRGWDIETLTEVARESLPELHERWCRTREAMEYARRLGATHIGLSFCVGLRREAHTLTKVLEANGFRVTSVCCKTGAVAKEEIGIQEHQKVRPSQPEMICNPIAQAELLNRAEVELAFILGQCVGHDSATLAHLDSPAICIVVKDRVLAHNTVAALYQLDS
ncbi:MAG: DUF1847 domain-containing protein [Gemmatimonadales bacterium]